MKPQDGGKNFLQNVGNYQSTPRHISEDSNFNIHEILVLPF